MINLSINFKKQRDSLDLNDDLSLQTLRQVNQSDLSQVKNFHIKVTEMQGFGEKLYHWRKNEQKINFYSPQVLYKKCCH